MGPGVPSTGVHGRWGLLKWHLSPLQAMHPNKIFLVGVGDNLKAWREADSEDGCSAFL